MSKTSYNCSSGNRIEARPIVSIAAYLPQFHEIPENDLWWGRGFTEWTLLKSARHWFSGHAIRRPGVATGEYVLPDKNVMERQFQIANSGGIDGFAIWNYWFGGGDVILEYPIEFCLKENINFDYCIFWANHSWANKTKNIILKEQRYLGASDYEKYFQYAVRHFRSAHYLKIDGRPIFGVFDPLSIPDLDVFVETWERLAVAAGFPGIYWLGDKLKTGHPAARHFQKIGDGFAFWTDRKKLFLNYFKEKLRTKLNIAFSPQRYKYEKMIVDAFDNLEDPDRYIPTVLVGWDTTPRHGPRGVVFDGFDPKSFARHLADLEKYIKTKAVRQPVVVVKSWNEWGEGNALEPDDIHGTAYLDIYRAFVDRVNARCEDLRTA